MDIQTRKKISRAMKGKSNFEGHRHTHASKIAIAFSQEGHKNAKDHKWAVDKETGKETRVKPGANLPRGNKWGRTAGFREWIKEEVLLEKKKVADAVEDFVQFAKGTLNLDTLPQIDLNYDLEAAEKFGAFGGYYPEEQRIELNVAGRHTMDILRTLAHELVHYRQGTLEPLPEDAGDTGSPYENEANALAGVMMREYGQRNTHMFSEEVVVQEAKATKCGRCGTTHVPPKFGGKCPALNEDLRKWFKEKWVRMDTKGNIKGDCAREPGEGKPKCLPQSKAQSMNKQDRAAAARRKRREDPVADRAGKGNKPINVATEEKQTSELIKQSHSKRGAPGTLKAKIDGPITLAKVKALKNKASATTLDKKQANFFINMHSEAKNFKQQAAIAIAMKKAGKKPKNEQTSLGESNKPTNPELWSKAKSLARSKFDVYPSAYANGWAAKWYKSKGGGWKSVSEGNNSSNRLEGTASLAQTYSKDTPGQKMKTLKQLKEMIGRKVRCDNCDGWMAKGEKHSCTVKEARMSAALKLQRAFQREQEKSAASRARAEKLLGQTPTPPAPKK